MALWLSEQRDSVTLPPLHSSLCRRLSPVRCHYRKVPVSCVSGCLASPLQITTCRFKQLKYETSITPTSPSVCLLYSWGRNKGVTRRSPTKTLICPASWRQVAHVFMIGSLSHWPVLLLYQLSMLLCVTRNERRDSVLRSCNFLHFSKMRFTWNTYLLTHSLRDAGYSLKSW